MMSSDSFIDRPRRNARDGATALDSPSAATARMDRRDGDHPLAEDRVSWPGRRRRPCRFWLPFFSRVVARYRLQNHEHVRAAPTARCVLVELENFPRPRCAPVVAARTRAEVREPASFVEKFALAETRASGGINHGTVRNESTPRMRAASILPITHTKGRQESSSRVTPSRLAGLSSMSMWSTAQPSRSDRISEGCRTSEDQGGPQ